VTVENWSRPAEVDERPLHHAPISYEELEAFADALAAADDVMPFVLDAG
jgi:hypothetical protein